MARLKEFQSDQKAIDEGEWVLPGEAVYGDLEIKTRGFSDQFKEARARRWAKASAAYNGTVPEALGRKINAELLADFLILDVRNLTHDSGEPVTVAEFRKMLLLPEWDRLARACWDAAAMVTNRSMAQREDAAGNSSRPSGIGSIGETSEPN
jgi:hypothetical protein